MNRADFQQLADIRIDAAKTLLDAGKYDGAFYLAGYAVECALKACIAKLTNQYDFPRERSFVQDCYTHDFSKLLNSANLGKQRASDATQSPDLLFNWQVVERWSEASRYERKLQADAQWIYDAVTDANSGVLPWIKRYW